ncbi:MAG: FAD-dependent monooxygenase [Polaromonas sp.]|nr:FAD-dependent monooxygenase [Polaromonas sp.]
MTDRVLVAGGGIGGLAAALAISRAGWGVQLFEKAAAFSEVGAGIQLGPNVVKVLYHSGLARALEAVAAFPERLQVRSALSGAPLGGMRLGRVIAARYGAPYATVHRADLHGLLLDAVQQSGATLHLNTQLQSFSQTSHGVTVQMADETCLQGNALVGADGLWSTLRQQLLADGPPRLTGHLAYRALVQQSALPEKLRTQNVTVWMGPRMHLVQYPVKRGEWLNVVAFVHGAPVDDLQTWDHSANSADLAAALGAICTALRGLVQAVPGWRLWVMHDRPPMQGAYQHAQGRVALLGDAAHPMRPYLAQGAGMAIEDAAELGRVLSQVQSQACDMPTALQHYAQNRWQRNARVQARALRNGEIFHAEGLLRWGRDAAMKVMGEKLLDMPWLYGGTTADRRA